MSGDGRIANVAGAVLIGGASSRMGGDKAQRPFGGVPSATRTSRLLATLFEDVMLVGGEAPADAVGRRIEDASGPRCALRGIVAALEASSAERVLIVATDLPLLTPALLLALVAWPVADVVLPRRVAQIEPLCALWSRERAAACARAQLEAGRLALHEVVAQLDAHYLKGADLQSADPDSLALANANTQEAWTHLESLPSELGGGVGRRRPALAGGGKGDS